MLSPGVFRVKDLDQVAKRSIQPWLAGQHVVAPVERGVVRGADDQVVTAVSHDGALPAGEHEVSSAPEGRQLHRSAARDRQLGPGDAGGGRLIELPRVQPPIRQSDPAR